MVDSIMRSNYMKYNFNFEKVYKKLQEHKRGFFLPRTKYYYLERQDFFHIVVEKALKYIEKSDLKEVSEDQFISIFWTTFKWERLNSHNGTKPAQEYKNFISRDHEVVHELSDKPIDLDLKWMVEEIDDKYPTIKMINTGHNFTTASKLLGISNRGVSMRYHKELEKLKKNYNE